MLRWLPAAVLAAVAVYVSGILDGGPPGPSLMFLPVSLAVAYVFYRSA